YTAPRNSSGCQAIADQTQIAQVTETGQNMNCSSAEWLKSGIVVALAPASAVAVTASPTPTLVPTPTSAPTSTPTPNATATASPTRAPDPSSTALPVSVLGATTRQEIDSGTSTILPLPDGGQTVSSATLVMIQCFVRAGVPTVAVPAGWNSFVSS